MQLRVGHLPTQNLGRTRSVLTVAASAGMLARGCAADTSNADVTEMKPHGFDVDVPHKLIGMSWSDNLFIFGNSVCQARATIGVRASYLWQLCGLS